MGSEPIERNAQAPPPSDWDRLDRILDEALAGTFPASDPIAICTDTVVGPAARQSNRTASGAAAKRALRPAYHYRRHSLLVRLTHSINAVAAALLLMSGLQIFNAHPNLYWGDSSYSKHAAIFVVTAGEKASGAEIGVTRIFGRNFNTSGILGLSREDGSLTERAFPPWITIPSNQWLAMGRRWHLFFAWVLVINGIVYVVHSVLSRHFSNDLAPPRHDWRSIGRSVLDHLRLRHPLGEAARHYNILQKLTYLMVIFVLLPFMVLTGCAMSPRLDSFAGGWVDFLGGRQTARTLHFIVAWTLVLFVLIHVFEVIVTGLWNNIRSMITGRYKVPPQPVELEANHGRS